MRRLPPRAPGRETPRPIPITRAEFDRLFDRYLDALWSSLAPHAEAKTVESRVEQIMIRVVLRWSEGLCERELDRLVLELTRGEEEALRKGSRVDGSSSGEVSS